MKMFKEWRDGVLAMPRTGKRALSLVVDTLFILSALWVSFALRYESLTWFPSESQMWAFATTLTITLGAFIKLGLYRAVIRYISERALLVIIAGVFISSLSLMVFGYLWRAPVPRSVPVMYAAFVFMLVAGSRFGIRALINHPREKAKGRILIVGAGELGMQLASALKQGVEHRPVGFVSIDQSKHKSSIAGLPVYGIHRIQRAIREQEAERVFLALGDQSGVDRRELMHKLEKLSVPVQTVPGMAELVAGQARINDIRDLEIEDLLGRAPVSHSSVDLAENLRGKRVLVSGAGGSIGAELCRQIVRHRPACLVLLERTEFSLYNIERELRAVCSIEGLDVEIYPLLGDVRDRKRCETVMRTFGVQVVFHAAAYKHVPLVEHNVIEGVQNNVFGTWRAAEAAIAAGVERFVLVSTDKAVRPTNVMGASKRLAELVLQGLAARQSKTVFTMVRFGNVLGSSGSVVPLFRDQIRDGGPVTVTHPNIIRYFMTIPEATQLVLEAAAMGKGGEVFVLDMGEPVKIADLARKMILLMGLTERTDSNPEGDIELVYTGLRPGEKLYEELLIGDDPQGTAHPRIMMARETAMAWPDVELLLERLSVASRRFDCREVVNLLRLAPTGYSPADDVADAVWCNGLDPAQAVNDGEPGNNKVRVLFGGDAPSG